jgi:hypothetical protein
MGSAGISNDGLQTVLTVRHVPGNLNLIADALSLFRVPLNTNWELHPVIFQAIALIWDRPLIDLFATSLNYKLETFNQDMSHCQHCLETVA